MKDKIMNVIKYEILESDRRCDKNEAKDNN